MEQQNTSKLEVLVNNELGIKNFEIEESIVYDASEIASFTNIVVKDNTEYLAHVGSTNTGNYVILITDDCPSYKPVALILDDSVIKTW